MTPERRGWYSMACWNGLSTQQQDFLIHKGVLPVGHWEPAGGTCDNGATTMVEHQDDEAPGPRFYCLPCAIKFLESRLPVEPPCPAYVMHGPGRQSRTYCTATGEHEYHHAQDPMCPGWEWKTLRASVDDWGESREIPDE